MRKKHNLFILLAISTMAISMIFTGCGNTDTTTEMSTTATDVGTTVPDTVGDAVGGVGNAVGGVVDDVGDAVGDMVNGGFENYNDAHDYIMGRMTKANANGKYEVRNASKELVDYNNGSKGYKFEFYDTTTGKGTRLGEFYVDSKDGRVYQKGEKDNKFTEYKFDMTNK